MLECKALETCNPGGKYGGRLILKYIYWYKCGTEKWKLYKLPCWVMGCGDDTNFEKNNGKILDLIGLNAKDDRDRGYRRAKSRSLI